MTKPKKKAPKKDYSLDKFKAARRAVFALFSNRKMDRAGTLEALKKLREEIEDYIKSSRVNVF